ncbi:hypothetical protein [Ruegeria atlantica]|uniref:Uncharacterized protein n=1 Tax=Ruegeria atlantica TaxID=81569 RepID=A0A0N7LNP8_9RHOB|nr:hypothetical protein [Ruegeria atlantica]CUH43020.1 hypothetical protein RUM4293_01909 [Ruegeria atlantica]
MLSSLIQRFGRRAAFHTSMPDKPTCFIGDVHGCIKLLQKLLPQIPRDHRIIGSSDHRIIGSSDHRIIGSSDHRIIGSSDHRIIGSSLSEITSIAAKTVLTFCV